MLIILVNPKVVGTKEIINMNKYSWNYMMAQKEENPWMVALGALSLFVGMYLFILILAILI